MNESNMRLSHSYSDVNNKQYRRNYIFVRVGVDEIGSERCEWVIGRTDMNEALGRIDVG